MNLTNRYLFLTVFLTGAGVLVLEVAAVRQLAPFYGSSLYVFSSVLTVILTALSVGYWYGGKRADERHAIDDLFRLITISGLLVLVQLVIATAVLPGLSTLFSVSIGPLIFSFTLFFLPAFLLGMVSPYIIKLQSLYTPADEIGSVVGKTFFWGTAGSIIGSIACGFWLIPAIGVEATITLVSILLLAVGTVIPLFLNRPITRRWYGGIFLVCIVFAGCLYWLTAERSNSVLYYGHGLYSSIVVRDITLYGQPVRLLQRDTNNSSAIYLHNTDLVFDYTRFVRLYETMVPEAEHLLMLGGGAYAVPRTLQETDPDLKIDVVEIEPELYDIAQEYFDFAPTENITNYAEDARVFLNRTDKTYDVIFADLFSTNLAAPFHLATREYYELLYERLNEDGIVIINYIGDPIPEAPSLTGSMVKTLTSVFPNSKAFLVDARYRTQFQNIIFVSRKSEGFDTLPETIALTGQPSYSLKDAELNLMQFDTAHEVLLTDDHAPVDRLMAKQR